MRHHVSVAAQALKDALTRLSQAKRSGAGDGGEGGEAGRFISGESLRFQDAGLSRLKRWFQPA